MWEYRSAKSPSRASLSHVPDTAACSCKHEIARSRLRSDHVLKGWICTSLSSLRLLRAAGSSTSAMRSSCLLFFPSPITLIQIERRPTETFPSLHPSSAPFSRMHGKFTRVAHGDKLHHDGSRQAFQGGRVQFAKDNAEGLCTALFFWLGYFF